MKKISTLIFILSAFWLSTSAQLVLVADTPANAVQNNLLGTGVIVNNVTYQGVANSLATFSGSSGLGISNGIYFGTGEFSTVANPSTYFMSDPNSGPGDIDLQAIAGGTTQDAAVLEFDFKVQGDSVKFNFVFASEEYNDFVNTGFNDVFAFFISGPGITGSQNIALVPEQLHR